MSENKIKSLLLDDAKTIVLALRKAGFQALFAGGCVRDMIMNREPKDVDIVTDAPPEKVVALFPQAITVGKAFGVVRVGIGKNYYDVATYRKDGAYDDGRHPRSVAFGDEHADAERRDFTINAIFFDPATGDIRDHVGGRNDIDKKIIRTVGDPGQRFQEDHLRMLRAVRFAATLDFNIEPRTAAAVKDQAHLICRVSAERIQQELTRILLESKQSGNAFELLSSLGLLKEILPEVEALRGQEQPPQFHPEGDVWTHTILMLNAMKNPSLRLAYAVLLHDVGKPGTAVQAEDRIRFNRHAELGATIAAAILQRLRLPSADIKAVSHIIGNHMRFMDVRRMRQSTLRRLITAETFPVELELHRLDCVASHGDMQNFSFLTDLKMKFESEPVLPQPLVSGEDIIACGVPRGPLIGRLKKAVYDAQLEDKFNGRAEALEWLRKKIETDGR